LQDLVMSTPDSQDSFTLTELDLAVVHALQVAPRASWSQVGRVLGVDASTVARRWARMEARGAAWSVCQPLLLDTAATACMEVTVGPGRTLEVAAILAQDPEAMTIDVAAGGRDLIVTLTCADAEHLAAYLLERVPHIPHVARVQSHVVVRSFTDASRWRLRALTSAQEAELTATLPEVSDAHQVHRPTALDHRLVAALSVDGRRAPAELATDVGASESTVRRRLNTLVGSGVLRLRCEVARSLSGWPVSAWLFLRVPSDRIDEAGQVLAGVPEVRAVLNAVGPANLLVAVWLRTSLDSQRLETQLLRRLPYVEVTDRSIVIRPFKLVGRLLDPRGYAVGVVPLALPGADG
jgi:DNA-binding Lrp family transcriptional regulator